VIEEAIEVPEIYEDVETMNVLGDAAYTTHMTNSKDNWMLADLYHILLIQNPQERRRSAWSIRQHVAKVTLLWTDHKGNSVVRENIWRKVANLHVDSCLIRTAGVINNICRRLCLCQRNLQPLASENIPTIERLDMMRA